MTLAILCSLPWLQLSPRNLGIIQSKIKYTRENTDYNINMVQSVLRKIFRCLAELFWQLTVFWKWQSIWFTVIKWKPFIKLGKHQVVLTFPITFRCTKYLVLPYFMDMSWLFPITWGSITFFTWSHSNNVAVCFNVTSTKISCPWFCSFSPWHRHDHSIILIIVLQ